MGCDGYLKNLDFKKIIEKPNLKIICYECSKLVDGITDHSHCYNEKHDLLRVMTEIENYYGR